MPLMFIIETLCPWGCIPLVFSPLSLTPFFLCQFPFNWTFCHQTRFITCSAVEGNGAEIRICSVRDTGPSTEGCDLAGDSPRGGLWGSHPWKVWTWGVWAKERRSTRKGGGVGIVKGSWDPSVVAWIPRLALYLLSCVTFKPCKQWHPFSLAVCLQSD